MGNICLRSTACRKSTFQNDQYVEVPSNNVTYPNCTFPVKPVDDLSNKEIQKSEVNNEIEDAEKHLRSKSFIEAFTQEKLTDIRHNQSETVIIEAAEKVQDTETTNDDSVLNVNNHSSFSRVKKDLEKEKSKLVKQLMQQGIHITTQIVSSLTPRYQRFNTLEETDCVQILNPVEVSSVEKENKLLPPLKLTLLKTNTSVLEAAPMTDRVTNNFLVGKSVYNFEAELNRPATFRPYY